MSFFEKNILTKDELQKIAETIKSVERETIGEVRVNIHKRRSFRDKNLSLYDLAVKNFYSLGMDKTKEKSGVLILLLLSEHKFQIIGDEGINKRVSKEFWESLAKKTSEYFGQNKFSEGICYAVNEVGAVLKKEFPMKPGDTNELSNEVVIS
ncbi:MAG: TPM domain-containing protein [Ignavibacteriales bacterium]|nr:TPM domain-containing protein [Ignavibacteriales bacterium]